MTNLLSVRLLKIRLVHMPYHTAWFLASLEGADCFFSIFCKTILDERKFIIMYLCSNRFKSLTCTQQSYVIFIRICYSQEFRIMCLHNHDGLKRISIYEWMTSEKSCFFYQINQGVSELLLTRYFHIYFVCKIIS